MVSNATFNRYSRIYDGQYDVFHFSNSIKRHINTKFGRKNLAYHPQNIIVSNNLNLKKIKFIPLFLRIIQNLIF